MADRFDREWAPPRFSVLQVVQVSSAAFVGVITDIRLYADGVLRYRVGGEEGGGVFDEDDLIDSGRLASPHDFWRGPLKRREIVAVSQDFPDVALRGWIGEVTTMWEGMTDRYEVTFRRNLGGGDWEEIVEDVPVVHLRSTGEILPPDPVPRHAFLWRDDPRGFSYPTLGYTLVDEIEQYL